MRIPHFVFAFAALFALMGSVFASEPAATSEMPAALLDIGVEKDLILDEAAASEVRGEAITFGSVISVSNPFSGQTTNVVGFGFATPGLIAFGQGTLVGPRVDLTVLNTSNGTFGVFIR